MSYRSQLDKLVNRNAISAASREWLTAAFDPFHDQEHQLAGYPDADGSNTVVHCYQYQFDMAAPAGTESTWDAHVYNLPTLGANHYQLFNPSSVPGVSGYVRAGYVSGGPNTFAPDFIQSFVNAAASPSGSQYSLRPDAEYNRLPAQMWAAPGSGVKDLLSGSSRVVAAGFEVINTTSEVYKQGTLTAYRNPVSTSMSILRVDGIADDVMYAHADTVHVIGQPPRSSADAMMLRGSRTWPAADGAYVPIVFSSVQNPLSVAGSMGTAFREGDNRDVSMMVSTSYRDAIINDSPQENKIAPVNTSGVFMTGLHKSATITIKVRVYVERAPGFWDPQLSLLATPSAPFDPAALQLYSSVLPQLPVAVDFGSNGLGDWWRAVMGVVKTVAPAIAPVLGSIHPAAGMAARMVGTIAGSSFDGRPKSVMKQKTNAVVVVKSQKKKGKKNPSTK